MKINIAIPTIHTDIRHQTKVSATISAPGFGKSGVLDMNITDLQVFMLNKEAVDMFLLSAFIYGVDRFVDRYEHSEDGWSRRLEVTIPVYNINVWEKLAPKLEDTISFLTGDYWKFTFTQNTLKITAPKLPDKYVGDFGQVNLFSGGLDSLIGSIDYLTANPRNSLFVTSHFEIDLSLYLR
jgi:hypothetical protein